MINGIIFRILEKQNVIVTGQGMPVTELYYKINLKAVTKKTACTLQYSRSFLKKLMTVCHCYP
jgi:hypothetical protein